MARQQRMQRREEKSNPLFVSSTARPLVMRSSASMVMAPRGSPGALHSGMGAGASSDSGPCRTRMPMSALIMDFDIDQPRSGVSTP